MSEEINWEEVDEKIVLRISQEAETYLRGMMQAAVSSDQRSATLGGIFVAASTAISGALLVYITSKEPALPLFAGGLISAAMFAVSAGLCLHGTTPTEFYIAGNAPKNWYSIVRTKTSFIAAVGGDLKGLDRNIVKNEQIRERASESLKWGARLGISTPVVGTLVALLLSVIV